MIEFLAHHGGQQISEIRGLRLSDLARYQRAVCDRLKRDSPGRRR